MNSFLDLHSLSISGVIDTFDRVIFKGHLNGFFPDGAFGRYLSRRAVLLKDAGRFFEAETQRIRDDVVSLAMAAGRPIEYLARASTPRSGASKEARAIAEQDGVTQGLVCVLWSPTARSRSRPTADPASGGGPPAAQVCTGSIPSLAGCLCGCRLGGPTRSRSTSTAASGWRGSSMRRRSGTGAATTRSPRLMILGPSRRCASGSPTPIGRRSSSARRPWSIRCCLTSRTLVFPATGG
jgi:hypothetical protein